jgi:hypothetical protein
MPNDVQVTQNHSKLTIEDVRHFIMDRTVADNPLLLDLAYSDDEIAQAIRFACLSFNEIPPYVYEVNPECIPFSMLFMHGAVYHCYLGKMAQLMRRDMDHQAGSMTVDITKRQIANLQVLIKLHKDEFEGMAKQRKISANVSAAFRHFSSGYHC